MKRPLTTREQETERIRRMWALAVAEGRTFPKPIRGFSVHPCPGDHVHFGERCTAPDAWVGSFSCGVQHRYYHTNHEPGRR